MPIAPQIFIEMFVILKYGWSTFWNTQVSKMKNLKAHEVFSK